MDLSRRSSCLLLLGAVACSVEDAGSGRSVAGSSDIDVDALPRLVLVEEARIGSVEDPDYGFSRIGGVDMDREGNVYLFESLSREIRVYAPDGRLLRRFGRSGEGPGEFSTPAVGFGVAGDTVWAVEPFSQRLTLFDREGQVLSSTRFEEVTVPLYAPGEVMVIQPMFFREDGSFFGDRGGIRRLREPEGTPHAGDSLFLPQIRFDARGRVLDTVGWSPYPSRSPFTFVAVGPNRYRVPEPPGDDPLLINLPSGSIRLDRPSPGGPAPASFRLTRFDLSGDTVRTRTFRYRPIPYPEALLDSLAARAARRATDREATGGESLRRPPGLERVVAAVRDRMSFPDFQLPIQAYEIARGGTVWLRREATGAGTHRWMVLDAEDMPVGEVEVPSGFRIARISDDTVWTVEADEFDVPWLVRYRFRPAGF
jgi:hypothetical protein